MRESKAFFFEGFSSHIFSNFRLQIRQTDGKPLVQTFKAKESLSAVRLYAQLNRKDLPGEKVKYRHRTFTIFFFKTRSLLCKFFGFLANPLSSKAGKTSKKQAWVREKIQFRLEY